MEINKKIIKSNTEPDISVLWLTDEGIKEYKENGWELISGPNIKDLDELYVRKEGDKQLSTNDFSTEEKKKLSEIEEHANNYIHPTTAGNKHIPAGGKEGQMLVNDGNGSAKWSYGEAMIDVYSYGVEWDINVADPTLTRIGNLALHKSLPIQSQYKGCVANGAIINYYLDPNDWSKKITGEDSVLDGTDGSVRVHIPKFYGKSGENGDKRWVRISTIQIDDTWVEIPEMLIDAYNCVILGDKVISIVNSEVEGGDGYANCHYTTEDPFRSLKGKPTTDTGIELFRKYANNADSELLCYEFYKWVFYWALVIEYATFNIGAPYNAELTADGYHQGGLGSVDWNRQHWLRYNNKNPIVPCGYCNEFGNFTGVKELVIPDTPEGNCVASAVPTKTLLIPRWRGFEGIPIGDINIFLDGCGAYNGNFHATSDPSLFPDVGSSVTNMPLVGKLVTGAGFIKALNIGETGEIIPSEIGGSSTTYMCSKQNVRDISYGMLSVCNNAANKYDNGGLLLFAIDNMYSSSSIGARTLSRIK